MWPDFRDPVSSWTHLFGALAAVVGTFVLWRRTAGDVGRRTTAVVFGVSMVLLYSASTLYHAVQGEEETVCFCRKLDLCAIFLLIAGTYTPVYYAVFAGLQRLVVPGAVWSLAAVGIAGEFTAMSLPDIIGPAVYIFVGWLAIVSYRSLAAIISHRRAFWMFVGGGFYTVGAIINELGWPVIVPGVWGAHEVFHVFVLAGSLTFFFWITFCILPFRPGEPEAAAAAALLSPQSPTQAGTDAPYAI